MRPETFGSPWDDMLEYAAIVVCSGEIMGANMIYADANI
jgi:hypothetical protein